MLLATLKYDNILGLCCSVLPCSLCSTFTSQHDFVGRSRSASLLVDLPESNLCYECNWMRNHSGWLYFLWLCEASDLPTAGCPREPKNSPRELAKKSDGDASPCGRQARQGLVSGCPDIQQPFVQWKVQVGRQTYAMSREASGDRAQRCTS